MAHLTEAGLEVPPWTVLRDRTLPEPIPQNPASPSLINSSTDTIYWPELSDLERVLMRSRLLLLRRLRSPLPLTSRTCRCDLDSVGHCRAACSVAGVLGEGREYRCVEKQGRECEDQHFGPRHGSGRSTCSIVADGLVWYGATLVSLLHRDGNARRTAADRNTKQARRLKESTFPELSGEGGGAPLVVLAAEVGGRWSEETAQFLRALAKAHAQTAPLILRNRVKLAPQMEQRLGLHACVAVHSIAVTGMCFFGGAKVFFGDTKDQSGFFGTPKSFWGVTKCFFRDTKMFLTF